MDPRFWVGPLVHACANDYKFGTTRIVQCASGVPTTTQIAYNTYGRESSVTTAPKSWVSFQDHSVSLVPIDASESTSGWFAPQPVSAPPTGAATSAT
jgi:hypothetical protein